MTHKPIPSKYKDSDPVPWGRTTMAPEDDEPQRRGPTMEGAPTDTTCEECGFHFWVCQAMAYEAMRRGSSRKHRAEVEAECLAGTWKVPHYDDEGWDDHA